MGFLSTRKQLLQSESKTALTVTGVVLVLPAAQQLETSGCTWEQSRKQPEFWWSEVKFEQRWNSASVLNRRCADTVGTPQPRFWSVSRWSYWDRHEKKCLRGGLGKKQAVGWPVYGGGKETDSVGVNKCSSVKVIFALASVWRLRLVAGWCVAWCKQLADLLRGYSPLQAARAVCAEGRGSKTTQQGCSLVKNNIWQRVVHK